MENIIFHMKDPIISDPSDKPCQSVSTDIQRTNCERKLGYFIILTTLIKIIICTFFFSFCKLSTKGLFTGKETFTQGSF